MVYGDYTERRILIYYKPPAVHKSIELWVFPFNARFNYSAAPHAFKLYRTVYSLKTRRRSFHTFTRPLFLNDATVYTAFIPTVWKKVFAVYCTCIHILFNILHVHVFK